MQTKPNNERNPLMRLWHWFQQRLIEDVPQDIAVCEFDCRKGQCLYDEWSSCERRISKAAGELMPAPPNSPSSPKT
jgi:hypothetical protein